MSVVTQQPMRDQATDRNANLHICYVPRPNTTYCTTSGSPSPSCFIPLSLDSHIRLFRSCPNFPNAPYPVCRRRSRVDLSVVTLSANYGSSGRGTTYEHTPQPSAIPLTSTCPVTGSKRPAKSQVSQKDPPALPRLRSPPTYQAVSLTTYAELI